MDILTYVQPSIVVEKKYTSSYTDFRKEINFTDNHINTKYSNELSEYTTVNSNFERKKYIHINFYLATMMLSMAVFIFAIGFSIKVFGKWNLHKFSFSESNFVGKMMQEYLFPQSDTDFMKDDLTSIPDFISIVTFENYTVRSGDTISGIAHKFGLKQIGTILSINGINNAKRLMVGEHLVIPSSDGVFHVVKSGESLSSISNKYGLPLTAILDANDLEVDTVQSGQKLFIPGASMTTFDLRKAMGELFIYPLYGRLTSPFGYRRDPFTGAKSFHGGIDLAARSGTPVKNVLDGKIVKVGYSRVYGNYIIISHSGSYQSFYGHLSKVYVKRGQYIIQGGKIGSVGTTGRSTGPHLHLSIYRYGKLLDPLTVLNK